MDRTRIALAIGAGTLVLIGGGTFVASRASRAPTAVPANVQEPVAPVPPPARSWLDGRVLAEGEHQPAAVAVVVDNAPEARPQSGIADAPLVFEAPVEGGRTRFLTVFPVDAATGYDGEIGPVRSARPYLIGLSEMIAAPLVHVGGSTAALRLLRGKNHVDQYYDPPFRRVSFRSAPFNVYTTVGKLAEFVTARGWNASRAEDARVLWPYADTNTVSPDASGSGIRLSFGTTVVEWTFDAASGRYQRSVDGHPHRDANGKRVEATNVVVLRVEAVVLDGVGRLSIPALEDVLVPMGIATGERDGIGSRPAAVLTAGQRRDAGWGSGSPDADMESGMFRLHMPAYANPADTPGPFAAIPLRPGITWVEFVSSALP